ncbi:hypothetical protein PVK06_034915 [Gossypium arboreum]|uniref:AP2/ERF domain-containing protein n=1 Tax=Gossypium arboreum TaxID=29729 RepID=A0ABR0NIJ8_GOSAR|nr:hypothetical protein PVK06_034915 [Gossypium arboreum]
MRGPNKKSRIWLGNFPTTEMATHAHHVATIALRGRSACLNFTDSAWNLPIPASSNAKDIQKMVANVVKNFKMIEQSNENCRNDTKRGENILMEKGFYLVEEVLFGAKILGKHGHRCDDVISSFWP